MGTRSLPGGKESVLVHVLCSLQLLEERGRERGKEAACRKASDPKQEKHSMHHLQWFGLLVLHWETTM